MKIEEQGDVSRKMAIASDRERGLVQVVFEQRIGWLSLPPAEARALAAMLIAKADELDKADG